MSPDSTTYCRWVAASEMCGFVERWKEKKNEGRERGEEMAREKGREGAGGGESLIESGADLSWLSRCVRGNRGPRLLSLAGAARRPPWLPGR